MLSRVLQIQLIIGAVISSVFALSGTGGTPLGGMGTGYVLFDGQKFRVSGKLPPAAADHAKSTSGSQDEKQITASGFSFFVKGTAKTQLKATSEDAKCPLQTADFGTIEGVKFSLNAFGPYLPGEGVENYKLATSPMALFDITAINSGTEAVDAAVAMEFANGGLLGGANSGKVESDNKAISFTGSTDNAYLAVDCDGSSPAFSAGAAGTFSTDGKLANADGNLVGAKCSIPAGGTVHFKFVLSWYRDYGTEDYYYHNFYDNSKEVATFGLSKFDAVRDGITGFVSRLMASNFPDWYKDRLLNNTYPLVHNSVVAKDGRVAFWEGNYGILGTIDQGQHAAVFYTFNWPSVQWHELQYWARQQKSSGQIHHDFNQGKSSFSAGNTNNNRNLKEWDNQNHADYWWFSNTDTWADLNCMFIFKAYELMLATGDLDSLKKSWPALKKAADRLVSMCGSDGIPLKSHSTYDRCNGEGNENGSNCGLTPEYNSGLTITTFRAIAEIARFCGEASSVTTYTEHANKAQQAFKTKYGNSNIFGVDASVKEPLYGRFPEGHIAGYSWANYLCLNPIMDNDFITNTVKKMRDKQKAATGTEAVRANGEWIFYCVDHYGGAEIAINQPDAAMYIHKQDYDYYYKSVPKEVHWQSLQEGDKNTHHDSYMTAPTVWHSYFQFCGYMIDNANNRLWIRPRVPSDMNGKITKALLLNPKSLGTLDYDENGNTETGVTQTITVKYDKPVTIKEFVLKNNTGIETPYVSISGAVNPTIKVEGSDPEKNIRVTLAAPIQIGPSGIQIQVSKKPVSVADMKKFYAMVPLSFSSSHLSAGTPICFSVDVAGSVKMELLSINGAKIGTIMNRQVSAGSQAFNWNGKTIDGRSISSMFAVLKLTSPNGTVTKMVSIGR
ncbi:MAG TPA: GH116 family glycosyl hydrolase [Chitinispirillaceae bacterium]|nr:GH116 family glycosyl hydrolase [Chitinispirillaceae bacterium]